MVLPTVNAASIAQRERFDPRSSENMIEQTYAFIKAFSERNEVLQLQEQAKLAKNDVQNILNVSLLQYIYGPSGYSLRGVNYFDATEPEFELFAWLIMFDWVQGLREVVSFEGDLGKLTSMSTSTTFIQVAVNPMEIPLNIAYYMRWLLQYITWVMLGVACLVCLYIIGLRGQIEASNMTSFSRVTALVWIGRPLIFLRALSAISLLATSTLQLTRPYKGLVTYFTSVPRPWYIVVLAAGELNWMVYIINDVLSLITHQCTQGYSIKSFILVWIASAVWAFAAPPTRSITIDRACTVAQVDYQVVCNAGTIAIGSVTQFYGLLGLVAGCCAVCYAVERCRHEKPKYSSGFMSSNFLYAAAKHQFRTDKWEYHNIQYLDKASAVLTGILSYRIRNELYIFDIKTWRMYAIPTDQLGLDDPYLPEHLAKAIPLVE
ncbi:Aste57867_554 [Aphanomyces stellatus]|uniref:Aste57867_554 protein n=1 Tax=Aphanomyces stellatus TaxID=120398 RepID=A0A485K709_9STRA|nr:hypothetical protein As57867_000553 [Aphanomyces stellatus]VFT77779.1 Aste57867_554 [Aphanomyces stellatus]